MKPTTENLPRGSRKGQILIQSTNEAIASTSGQVLCKEDACGGEVRRARRKSSMHSPAKQERPLVRVGSPSPYRHGEMSLYLLFEGRGNLRMGEGRVYDAHLEAMEEQLPAKKFQWERHFS